MQPATIIATINGRYRLLALLGEGAMGVVSRAYDRLTSQEVALKQVLLPPGLAPEETEQELLTLAHEFRVLAGLRHPHIISVLDYGFDAERRPFFTMELLEAAQPILDAGAALPLAGKVELILQAAEALAYLHRRGVLHHDLKPANVLVAHGRLRLLDFGLAVLADQQRSDDAFGTLQYLAPEVLDGQPYTEAADLYSLGVIAYELLVGAHPFPAETVSDFLDLTFAQPPDLSPLADQPDLAAVVGQLLAKHPAERPASAPTAIMALRTALGLPAQEESGAIRESYLQAAAFVGRETELAQLTDALEQARQGRGRAFLIGGESGVGKSRLLDELRTLALVAGCLVLEGQGVEGGGLPYQLWREPLRRLALSAELSELEAGVLKPLVPDLAPLLARAVPDAPVLNGAENLQRLVRVVIDLLRRQEQPLVLLLEDLQWAEESLLLLHEAVRLLADRPVLIMGNYRDDERPHLPKELPGMRILPLTRLDAAEMAQLSAAMLGDSGRQPEVLALLEQETEGNTFFMVEVARALAEESGRLADIGHTTLPAQVFTGGIQRLIERRLQQVSPEAYGLVQLAAVLGRRIDLAALKAAAPTTNLEPWLLQCAEAVVLAVQGEQWRFAHDKLRAGALAAVGVEQQAALHLRAATAIEQAYAADLLPQAARLAEHYRRAGNVDQERQYAQQAGDYAAATFAHAEAVQHYRRTLELTEDARGQFELLLRREEVYDWQGERESQTADLDRLAELAEQLHDDRCRFEAAQRRIQQAIKMGDFPLATARVNACVQLAQTLADPAAEATSRLYWGEVAIYQGDLPTAEAQLNLALALARSAQVQRLEADCLKYLASVMAAAGDYASGRTLYEQALELSRMLGDYQREAAVLSDLQIILAATGDRTAAMAALERALHLSRMVGHGKIEAIILVNLGFRAHDHGDYDQAEHYYVQGFQLAQLNRDLRLQTNSLLNQGALAHEMGDYQTAQILFDQALQQTREMQSPGEEAIVLIGMSYLALARLQTALAEQHACATLKMAQDLGLALEQQMAWNALGQIQIQQGDPVAAIQSFQAVLTTPLDQSIPTEVVIAQLGLAQVYRSLGQLSQARLHADQALDWLDNHQASGLNDPLSPYLICYQVLVAQGDPRAAAVLATGYQELQRRAATISDPARQRGYLQNVRANRELLAAWSEQTTI